MSVSLTHYLGIGYKLDYDKYTDRIDDFLDLHSEYSRYEHINPNAAKGGLQIIVDGMNGNYIYVMYVLQKTSQYDMYSSSGDVDISMANIESEAILASKLYHMILPDEPITDPHLVSLFHCA